MSERMRRWLIMTAIVIIAAILAFPLRETIYDVILVPAAFVGWRLGLVYRSFAQVIWWWAVLVIVFIIIIFSLVPQFKPAPRELPRSKPRLGQIEDLATWMGRSKGGVYFKWLIANRLGKIAYQILLHRESGRPRSVFTPLLGPDWEPSSELQNYLETGLHGSFSDFPNLKRPLKVQTKTPLDYDMSEAVEFLESQVEGRDLPKRR